MRRLISILFLLVFLAGCGAWPNGPVKIEGEVDIIPQSGSSPTAVVATATLVAPLATQTQSVVQPTATSRVIVDTPTTAPTNPPLPTQTANIVVVTATNPPAPTTTTVAAENCNNPAVFLEHSPLTVYAPGTNSQITVTNLSKSCTVLVGMSSHKIGENRSELYAWDQRYSDLNLSPGETINLDVPIPQGCQYSITTFWGSLSESNDYAGRIIQTVHSGSGLPLCNLN